MTRGQRMLVLAEKLVTEVEEKPEDVRSRYGNLCHGFPVLVRTAGLCQALAFSKDKSTGDGPLARAHGLILAHVAQVLEVTDGDPLSAVRTAGTLDYMLKTRQVLDAWIYFKRFAVSILKVEAGEDRNRDATD
jgi:CRISPR-associated protein Cmr5